MAARDTIIRIGKSHAFVYLYPYSNAVHDVLVYTKAIRCSVWMIWRHFIREHMLLFVAICLWPGIHLGHSLVSALLVVQSLFRGRLTRTWALNGDKECVEKL